jgi:EAL domain-containing protein (putative c-di-GMP-specific phosphodiesterase class I)
LRSRGAEIVLDDFGTGYSALSYLRDLPVTCVKIDKSFFTDIPNNLQSCAVVNAIINLSTALGLKVVAEGVETERQAAFLTSIECEAMQGFLVSPPLPPAGMTAWLESRVQVPG